MSVGAFVRGSLGRIMDSLCHGELMSGGACVLGAYVLRAFVRGRAFVLQPAILCVCGGRGWGREALEEKGRVGSLDGVK